MNVLVYRDGKLVCTDNPIQGTGNALDNLLMLVSEPQDGDVLKYDAANGMWVAGAESGGGGSGGGYLKVSMDAEGTLDKTWKEISDALSAGYYVNIIMQETEHVFQNRAYECLYDNGDYNVNAYGLLGNSISVATFITDSENGYPVMQSGGGDD
jgi:hypothetical protein